MYSLGLCTLTKQFTLLCLVPHSDIQTEFENTRTYERAEHWRRNYFTYFAPTRIITCYSCKANFQQLHRNRYNVDETFDVYN